MRSASASVTRSRPIAITTIATPARIASAGLELSPFVTGAPKPPFVSISPAITTIESAKRIVWFTDRSSRRRASGSCTFQSTCRPVEPSAVAASTVFSGTPRMPSDVMRTAGGTA